MGFTNTEYRNSVTSLTQAQQDRLQNPYYKFINQKPTVVTYWNMNTKLSTLDEGTKTNYAQLGKKSPLRYNKVKNFVLYGLPQFNVDMNLGEFGVESSEIGGEFLVLPNTIVPIVDDYFTIPYLTKPYIFRVNNVSLSSLESGQEYYICRFHLDNSIDDYVEYLNSVNLAYEYNFEIANVGTNKSTLFTDAEQNAISVLDKLYDRFRTYYVELFYKENVDTFIYGYLDMFIYDPYLLEFCIKNELFSIYDDKYLFLYQAVHKPNTFRIEYDNTILADVEDRESQLHTNSLYPVPVHDPDSLLVDRMESYVQLSNNIQHSQQNPINQIHNTLFDMIQQNTPFDEEDTKNPKLYWNIIVNYMNDENFSLTAPEIQSLLDMKIRYSKDLFYEIPILMYIIKYYINSLSTSNNTSTTGDNSNTVYLEECFAVGR
jgi:hypothetical protein